MSNDILVLLPSCPSPTIEDKAKQSHLLVADISFRRSRVGTKKRIFVTLTTSRVEASQIPIASRSVSQRPISGLNLAPPQATRGSSFGESPHTDSN